MAKKQKKSLDSRRPNIQTDLYFRRNSVVISKSQREVVAHKQTVSQRQQDAKRKKNVQQKKLIVLTMIGVIGVTSLFIRMRISTVEITPTPPARIVSGQVVNESIYSESVEQYIQKNVPGAQSWLVDSAELERTLQNRHPEVQSVVIDSNVFSGALNVRLQFRKPAFVLSTGENSLFIDVKGVIFTVNQYPGITISALPAVEDQGSGIAQTGEKIVTTTVAASIAKLYASLPGLYDGGAVVSKVLLPRSSREVHVKMSTVPYLIKFTVERDIDSQLGELRSLNGYLRSSNLSPLEYIDVRIEGKAFYK